MLLIGTVLGALVAFAAAASALAAKRTAGAAREERRAQARRAVERMLECYDERRADITDPTLMLSLAELNAGWAHERAKLTPE